MYFFVHWDSEIMPCSLCAAGCLSAIGSGLTAEGLVDECEPVCSVSSPSPVLGEDTALLRTVARGQQQFPALLPAAHAVTGKSFCLSTTQTWGSTSNWLRWEQTCQSFSITGLRGVKCIKPPPAKSSQLPVALGSVEASEKAAAELVFSYWNVRGQGLGREEPTWKHSCANRFTDLCNVPPCALAFSQLSHISFVPATLLLSAGLGLVLC